MDQSDADDIFRHNFQENNLPRAEISKRKQLEMLTIPDSAFEQATELYPENDVSNLLKELQKIKEDDSTWFIAYNCVKN
ncbi:39694_t:CDS:2, partial [Gigaspora margarita]